MQGFQKHALNMSTSTPRLVLLCVLGVALCATVTYGSLRYAFPQYAAERIRAASPAHVAGALERDPFAHVELEARAAYVFDVDAKTPLFSRNAEAQLPLASLTKLMTALVAAERIPEPAMIAITSNSIAQEGDSDFSAGETFAWRDLLALSLIESSNDGMHAIASASAGNISRFVVGMNERAQSLGLAQTHFRNPTGLDTTEQVSGGYGSARDMARLTAYIIEHEPDLLEPTRHAMKEFTSQSGAVHIAENTNEIVGNIPGLIASKTGFTDLAGGNLVVAFDAGINHPVVAVVLGSTADGRFRDMQKLITATGPALQERRLLETARAVE